MEGIQVAALIIRTNLHVNNIDGLFIDYKQIRLLYADRGFQARITNHVNIFIALAPMSPMSRDIGWGEFS